MTIEVLGLGDLRKSFAGLRDEMKMKTALRMVASAGGVLRTEAKRIAQSRGLRKTGAMIRNIAIKRERRAPAGTTQYNLGVRHGRYLGKRATKYLAFSKRKGRVVIRRKDDPFYYRFVERGHRIVPRSSGEAGTGLTRFLVTLKNGNQHYRTRKYKLDSITGRRRSGNGFVNAKPFLSPALENKRAEAIAAMEKRLQQDIEKASRLAAK